MLPRWTLVAVAAVTFGCGGGDDDSPVQSSATTSEGPSPSEPALPRAARATVPRAAADAAADAWTSYDPRAREETASLLRGSGTETAAGPLAPMENRRARRGVTLSRHPEWRAAGDAAERAAAWLAVRHLPDGGSAGYSATPEVADGEDGPEAGATGLALLAVLSAGFDHHSGEHRDRVTSGLRHLGRLQSAEGTFAPESLREHLVAALALVESYGGSRSVVSKHFAQPGVNFVHATQRVDGSWADAPDAPGDRATTASAVTLLVIAHVAELEVDRAAIARALAWLGEATPDAGTLLARVLGKAIVDPDGLRRDTALRAECDRLLVGLREDDLEAWHLGALAAFQLGGETWQRWDDALTRIDLTLQRQDGEDRGSWDPVGGRDDASARFRETALRCLTLGTRYRWPRIVSTP